MKKLPATTIRLERSSSVWYNFARIMFRDTNAKFGLAIVLGFLALILSGLYIAPYSPYATSSELESPPSFTHLFGTDYQGKDVFSQLVYGAIPSIGVGIASALGAVLIGLAVGVFAGYFTKWEGVLTGLTDIVIMFPAVPLIVLIGAIKYPSYPEFVLILSLVLWPPISRSIRSQVLSMRETPMIDVCKMSGMKDWEIVTKFIIRSVGAIAFAYFVLTAAASIVLVTGLEYIGVGNPDVVSWGSMIYWAQQFGYYAGAWWWIIAPGVAISLLTIGFALIGFSLEEALNPRLRRKY